MSKEYEIKERNMKKMIDELQQRVEKEREEKREAITEAEENRRKLMERQTEFGKISSDWIGHVEFYLYVIYVLHISSQYTTPHPLFLVPYFLISMSTDSLQSQLDKLNTYTDTLIQEKEALSKQISPLHTTDHTVIHYFTCIIIF